MNRYASLIAAVAAACMALSLAACAFKTGYFPVNDFRNRLITSFCILDNPDMEQCRSYVEPWMSRTRIEGDKAIIAFDFEDQQQGITFSLNGLKGGYAESVSFTLELTKWPRNPPVFLYMGCVAAIVNMCQPGTFDDFYREYEKKMDAYAKQHLYDGKADVAHTMELLSGEWNYVTSLHIANGGILYSFTASPLGERLFKRP